MEAFNFSLETRVINFLTDKALSILRIIENHPNQFSRNIMSILEENGIELRKSQFYRYIDTLESYELINITKWVKKNNFSGYTYEISSNGNQILHLLSEHFENLKP